MTYTPNPINTTNVVLPKEIDELTEKLAESTHDTWAKNRMEQGWTYGEKRDDENKLHPCLIPYVDLPESEKKYDRDTAMETLKAVYALGYRIVKEDVEVDPKRIRKAVADLARFSKFANGAALNMDVSSPAYGDLIKILLTLALNAYHSANPGDIITIPDEE